MTRDNPFFLALLTALAVLTMFPFVFNFMTSFMTNPQFFHHFWTPT